MEKNGFQFLSLLSLSAALFMHIHYNTAHAMVDLPAETVSADIILGDQERSPGTVSVLHPQELRGEQKDLGDILERIPGLHIIRARGRGGYTVASIRGSASNQVAVYVDGVLMNVGSDSAVDLSSIPVENVGRIEVYRGYIPARFGAAGMGGAINIVTLSPEKPQTQVHLGAGSYGSLRGGVSHSFKWGEGYLFSSLNLEKSEGDFSYTNDNGTPYTPEDDYTTRRKHNSFSNRDILIKWKDSNWQTHLSWVQNKRDLPFPAPGSDKPGIPSGADLDTERWDFSIGRHQQTGDVQWNWRTEYLSQKKKYYDPHDGLGGYGEQRNEYRNERFALNLDTSFAAGERHWLEGYAQYQRETLDAQGDIVTLLGGTGHFLRENWRLSLQDTIDLDGQGHLLLTPVLRWNKDDGDDHTTWALGLTHNINKKWTLKASYGTYSRAPNFYERYGDGATIRPSPNLKWETGTQWDIGLHWSSPCKKKLSEIGLTWFSRDSDNLIEYIQANPRFGVYQNIGKATVNGLELEMNFHWDKWHLFASGTWMDAENRTPGSYSFGTRLPNRPEWESLVRLTRILPQGSAFMEFQYIGDNYFDDGNDIRMNSATLWNIGLQQRLKEDLNLTVGVNDLFDTGNDLRLMPTGNGPSRMLWYPMQGRTLYSTLYWTF